MPIGPIPIGPMHIGPARRGSPFHRLLLGELDTVAPLNEEVVDAAKGTTVPDAQAPYPVEMHARFCPHRAPAPPVVRAAPCL
jgi:hypothetical protein